MHVKSFFFTPVHFGNGVRANGYVRDLDVIQRPVVLSDCFFLKLVESWESVDHLAKDCVLSIKGRLRRIEDEELGAVLVRATVRHWKDSSFVVLKPFYNLILEVLVFWRIYRLSTFSRSCRITTLEYEASYVPMEFAACVVSFGAERQEVSAGHWSLLVVELKLDISETFKT